MRHRLEDLGRIQEKLQIIISKEIFKIIEGRPKDFPEMFQSFDADKKYEVLYNLSFGIRELEEEIADCLVIAYGNDN